MSIVSVEGNRALAAAMACLLTFLLIAKAVRVGRPPQFEYTVKLTVDQRAPSHAAEFSYTKQREISSRQDSDLVQNNSSQHLETALKSPMPSASAVQTTPEQKCAIYSEESGQTFETLENGCLQHSSGMKLQVVRDVCVGPDSVILLGRDSTHLKQLRRCCQAYKDPQTNRTTLKAVPGCSPEILTACHAAIDKIGGTALKLMIWHKEKVAQNRLTFLEGNSFWLHTPNTEEHFGHQINRYMQLFNIMTEPNMPQIDRIVSRQLRPFHDHLHTVAGKIAAPLEKASYFYERMIEQKKRIVCMEKAWEATHDQSEFVLHTQEQGERWQRFAAKAFSQYGYTHAEKCPPAKAVVLQRTDGTGRRMILNYDVLDRVFAQHNMTYENVTIGSDADSAEQIGLFNSFGLMVSSHSSQLKNLIFAPKNSVVLEVRGTRWGYMQPSPFSRGVAKPLNVHFYESLGHEPDFSSCPEEHGCRKQKMYKTDFWLKEDLFEAALSTALDAQRSVCGNIWENQ